MTELIAGIDLGTSNSAITLILDGTPIVIPDKKGNRIHPSVVYFDHDGGTIIGNDAVTYLSSEPQRTIYSSKRLMGRTMNSPKVSMLHGSLPFDLRSADGSPDGPVRIVIDQTYQPPEGIGARILNYLKHLAEDFVGESVEKAIITVPANFDEAQRQATMHAGKLAGLEILQLVNEPTAAALAYGHKQNRRERIAIYDFGGGTFDITILELRGNVYEVLGTAGRSYLGGDDFDLIIVNEIIHEFERLNNMPLTNHHPIRFPLKEIAKSIKHKLSTEPVVTEAIRMQIPGTLNNFHLDFSITQQRFNELSQDLITRSLKTCEEALQLANLQPAQIEHLVMVGGSTRVPIVTQNAEEFFGRKATLDVNPDEVVSIGAAIYAQALAKRSAPSLPPSVPYAKAFQSPPAPPRMPPLPGAQSPYAQSGLGQQLSSPRTSSPPPSPNFSAPSQYAKPSGGPPPLPMPNVAQNSVPILIDVTPHALGIETFGGIMDVIIKQNSSLPLSNERVFVASRDNQTEVVVPIFAGSARKTAENRQLGTVTLQNIAPGLREDVQIAVRFEINTSGILSVKATDLRTGKAQSATLSISGTSSHQSSSRNTLSSSY